MAGLTPAHLLLILIIALIVVGPGKLPEVGAAIGKSFREFQKATGEVQNTLTGTVAPPPQSAPVVQQIAGAPQPPVQSYYANQPTYTQPVYPDPAAYAQPAYAVPATYAPPAYPVQPEPVPSGTVQMAPTETLPSPAATPSANVPVDPRVG